MTKSSWRRISALPLAFSILSIAQAFEASAIHAGDAAWPPPAFLGRWTGEGRLGFREGKNESVKCRVTYFAEAADLKQTIRCATAGANVEIQSQIASAGGGDLKGTWKETVYNLEGEITGKTTEKGFRVTVKSDTLSANMDLILLGTQQVIEIQFHSSTLLGLSLVLKKG